MKQDDLTILSYNIWNLPFFTPRGSFKRMKNIANFLKNVSTDIICLQEVWSLKTKSLFSNVLQDTYHIYSDGSKTRLHRKWLDFSSRQGGLLTLSKFPIISEKFVRFGISGRFWTEWMGDKGFLETFVKTPWGILRVINTHLHQPLASIRFEQIKKLFSYVSQDQETPTVLAGDFNQDQIMTDESFTSVITNTNFIHPGIFSAESKHTYRLDNPLTQTWINRLKESGHLDYIFTRFLEKFNLQVDQYTPVHLPNPLSDHDPVFLKLVNK
ncbi:endonuclease/exonuclease/phosphatase family protein [Candidatus Falkowbacteria bacterium]|nr:MAG: endonuclease/exonuclease/phosphatase family protein [Candidatus Falkowbacteria bacterium]